MAYIPCPVDECPHLSKQDREEGKTCIDHPCTCVYDKD